MVPADQLDQIVEAGLLVCVIEDLLASGLEDRQATAGFVEQWPQLWMKPRADRIDEGRVSGRRHRGFPIQARECIGENLVQLETEVLGKGDERDSVRRRAVAISASTGISVCSVHGAPVGIDPCRELQSDGRFSPSGLEFNVTAECHQARCLPPR